jgi:hypothetical protein
MPPMPSPPRTLAPRLRVNLSDTSAQAYLNYDTERDPGAGRLVRTWAR